LPDVDVTIGTRYDDDRAGPIPRELLLEARCSAPSLDIAQAAAGPQAVGLAPVAAFVANVVVETPLLHIAYDSTPGAHSREFLEAFLPDERGLIRPGGWLDVDGFVQVLGAWLESDERERLGRALGQYDIALRNWGPTSRLLVVAHRTWRAKRWGQRSSDASGTRSKCPR
jgi:hypothetical protein